MRLANLGIIDLLAPGVERSATTGDEGLRVCQKACARFVKTNILELKRSLGTVPVPNEASSVRHSSEPKSTIIAPLIIVLPSTDAASLHWGLSIHQSSQSYGTGKNR